MAVVALALLFALAVALTNALTASASIRPAPAPPAVASKPIVSSAVHHDVSRPLRQIVPAPALFRGTVNRENEYSLHQSVPTFDPVVQSRFGADQIPAPTLNFDGIGNGFSGPQGSFAVNSAPPDTNGDVGPNNYVQVVNTDFAVFNKSGAVLYGPVPLNTLWSGFGGGCQANNDGDPTVVYDPIADRWVISQFSVSTTPYLQCVAVSTTGDPTGTYYRYSFSYGNTDFPDYPKLGVWPDAYYTTFNIFGNASTFSGARVCAYDRTKMLEGAAASQQCFNTSSQWGGLLPSDLDGATLPPAGAPNHIVAFGTNDLGVWNFHVDWATPLNSTFTGPTLLPVAAFSDACDDGTCIPQAGTTQKLDSLGDRLMYRLAYRNFGDHQSLVVNHSVTAGSSVGVRWYELRVGGGGNLSVFQQGTYAPDSGYRWMGSIAQDQSGDIGLGFSLSSASLHPSIHYTGRLAGDPAGTMTQGEGTIIDGTGSQIGGSTGTPVLTRWGDYSSMSVDPSDDCTFWYTTEYIPANGSFNWKTRVGTFKFPSCGAVANDFSISANPSSLTLDQGQSGTSAIGTSLTSGSPESIALSVSGVPSGATAQLDTSSVSTGNSATLTINAGTAAAGSYPITVTGTGASASHSATVSLTVNAPPPNDFSISANPPSLTLEQGQSGGSTISTSLVSGSPESITLSVSGVPSGATAQLDASSVNTGNSATLTINAGTAAAGSYPITVTGTGASASHSATVSLTVNSPPPVVFNGGFETGTFSGWSRSGAVLPAIVTTPHTGSYAARLGSPAAFNGNSVLTQTVTVPAGSSQLAFWYQPHCSDSILFDQIQMQIRTTGGSKLATVLNDCSNSGVWTQRTFDTSAWAGQTVVLWFNVHDDGYPTDPTYSLLDDVAVTQVPPPDPNAVGNPGFEAGSLAPWSTGGLVRPTILPFLPHSGLYAAQLGSVLAFNGNSTLSQIVTVPAGAPRLSFWYRPFCPDTIAFDQQQMQIRSLAGDRLASVLNVCSNSGTWTQVNYNMSAFAGTSVVLWFNVHDDGYPGDPTVMLLDDVSLR